MDNLIGLTLLRVTGGSAKKDYPGNIWRFQLLLNTLQKYLVDPLDLHVVCPANELATTQTLFTSTSKVNLIWENAETYLPGIGASTANPWYLAQCLMFAFGVMQTKHVIKIDADELLVRPMREADIWQNGKSGCSMRLTSRSKSRFWALTESSFTIPLATPDSFLRVEPNPFVMSPIICQNILSHIYSQGKTFLSLASESDWIDFAAYTLVAQNTCGLLSQHFNCRMSGPNIDSTQHKHQVRDRNSFFVTLQSYMGLTQAETEALIAKFKIL
jgi:hypothetical protein